MPLFVVGVPDPDVCTGEHWTVTDQKAFKSRKDFSMENINNICQ